MAQNFLEKRNLIYAILFILTQLYGESFEAFLTRFDKNYVEELGHISEEVQPKFENFILTT